MDKAMSGGVFAHENTSAPKTTRIMPLFSLSGRTAIVSGAGAGIGLAVSKALAEAGANVAIWYNSNKKAVDRAADIEKEFGIKCRAYQVDVTDAQAVEEAILAQVKEFSGRLDIFVANSGIPWTQGAVTDGEVSHYQKVVRTDVDGVFNCARVAGRIWRDQKERGLEDFTSGSFIATASISGHIVNIPQLQAPYNAAKAAVIHLCYIATEITDFVPAETKNFWRDKTPMGREGQAHELCGAYLYLASDAASYTTGADILIDGGYCAP